MTSIPPWMQVLRGFALHNPVQRGTYRQRIESRCVAS